MTPGYLLAEAEIWLSAELLQEYREVPLDLYEEGKISRA